MVVSNHSAPQVSLAISFETLLARVATFTAINKYFASWAISLYDKIFLETAGYEKTCIYFTPEHAREELKNLQKISSFFNYATRQISGDEIQGKFATTLYSRMEGIAKATGNSVEILQAIIDSSLSPEDFAKLSKDRRSKSLEIQTFRVNKFYEADRSWEELLEGELIDY